MSSLYVACTILSSLWVPSDSVLAGCSSSHSQLYCSAGFGEACPVGFGVVADASGCWISLLTRGYETEQDSTWHAQPSGCFMTLESGAVYNWQGIAGLRSVNANPVCVQCAARQVGLCPADVCSRIGGVCSPLIEATTPSQNVIALPMPTGAVTAPSPPSRNAPSENTMPVGGSTWAPAPPWGQAQPEPHNDYDEDYVLADGRSAVGVLGEQLILAVIGLVLCCCCLTSLYCLKRKCGSSDPQKQKLYMDEGATSSDEPDPEEPLIVPRGVTVPPYWTNQDLRSEFDTREDVPIAVEKTIQAMLDGCWRDVQTRDRKGPVPARIEVSAVHRVEDARMWIKYQQTKADIMASRGGSCTPVHHLDGNAEAGFVKTMDTSFQKSPDFRDQLDPNANEFFLFHGTSPDGALGISEDGFRISMAGSNAGTMFGKGAYFAECSSKADEYSQDGQGIYKGIYGLIVCRVTCGEMLRVTRSNLPKIEKALDSKSVDSVLGDREASVGTYREFIVFREKMVYPEYVVLYKRRTEENE